MGSSSTQKIVAVNGALLATVIVLWWVLSLIVVRAVLAIPSVGPLLEAAREAAPAAQKFAAASLSGDAATAFYWFFLITTPFVAVFYFRATTVHAALPVRVTVIMWLLLALTVFVMSVGVDMGPSSTPGFEHAFNLILTSAWFGPSFIVLLFCHCFLASVVCIAKNIIAKNKGRRFS